MHNYTEGRQLEAALLQVHCFTLICLASCHKEQEQVLCVVISMLSTQKRQKATTQVGRCLLLI